LEAEHRRFQGEDHAITLQPDPSEWETQLCFPTAFEFMPNDHPNAAIRGMHFFTAVAHLLRAVDGVRDHDDTGCADMACLPRNEEQAHEYLGAMYDTGVRLMGDGRAFQQIQLSATAAKGMAGGSTSGLTPSHVATFFIQLFRAGARHRQKCPFDKSYNGPVKVTGSASESPAPPKTGSSR
jgi:hypothetical protein